MLGCFGHVQLFVTLWAVTKLLCPWDSPGKNAVVGCHVLLWGIALTQGSNPPPIHLLHHRQILYCWATVEAVFWIARSREINPEYSLEGLMLKLKLQYFGHLIQTADSLEKPLMLGKTEDRRRGRQRMRWLHGISCRCNGHELGQTLGDDGQGGLACCSPWGHKESGWVTKQQ